MFSVYVYVSKPPASEPRVLLSEHRNWTSALCPSRNEAGWLCGWEGTPQPPGSGGGSTHHSPLTNRRLTLLAQLRTPQGKAAHGQRNTSTVSLIPSSSFSSSFSFSLQYLHASQLTTHDSRLTTPDSRLTTHGSRPSALGHRLTAHYPLNPEPRILTTQIDPFTGIWYNFTYMTIHEITDSHKDKQ